MLKEYNRLPTEEVLLQLRNSLQETDEPQLHSFDFDRLYTGIPLDDLVDKFDALLTDL